MGKAWFLSQVRQPRQSHLIAPASSNAAGFLHSLHIPPHFIHAYNVARVALSACLSTSDWIFCTIMSFDRLSSLESQPTTTRRQDDPVYRDDPEFQRFTESLSTKLFELTSNISRLSNQIALLGTKRDTQRVRERVHDMLEETRDGFKEVGEGIKRAQAWEDLNVCGSASRPPPSAADYPLASPEIHKL